MHAVKEVSPPGGAPHSEAATFAACVATVLELALAEVPEPTPGQDPAADWRLLRWLGGLGLGVVPIRHAEAFSWAGPWIASVRPSAGGERGAVVMYGVPSGVAWDPAGVTATEDWRIEDGFLIATLDVALTRPSPAAPPITVGTVEALLIASDAGEPAQSVDEARALAGRGLQGDRHVAGTGTFPSGLPGSALTLIEAEVCESFAPALRADEHRRNVVTRGIDLNPLVGHEFMLGAVRCRGMRLCEPCTVIERYAARPVLRALVHRGGLRADILDDGVIHTGDRVRSVGVPA
jgi:MOSC domain-containing protein YiiM